MSGLYEALPWTDGQINPSGIAAEIYYCEKSSITTFPTYLETPTTASENVSLDGDFVMAVGEIFKRIYSTQGKGKVNWETLGEKDCKMFVNKGVFKFPDISDSGKSISKQFVNANCVFVVKLPHISEKRYVILGDKDYDTTCTITGDSGDEPGSAKGITIEITAPCVTPLPNYKGILEIDGGSLDCSTGTFTPSV